MKSHEFDTRNAYDESEVRDLRSAEQRVYEAHINESGSERYIYYNGGVPLMNIVMGPPAPGEVEEMIAGTAGAFKQMQQDAGIKDGHEA